MNTARSEVSGVRLKEVLGKLPGLTKADVQYWEQRSYIAPRRVPKARIERRDYGPAFEKIALMWTLCQQGMTPEQASKYADEMLKVGASPLDLLAEQAPDVLHYGPTSLREELRQRDTGHDDPAFGPGTRLAYPGSRKTKPPSVEDLLPHIDVMFTPYQLGLIAESLLSVLDECVNAILGITPPLSIVAGALSLIALERRGRLVSPFATGIRREKRVLVGAPAENGQRFAILVVSTADLSLIRGHIEWLESMGHEVVQLISVIGRENDNAHEILSQRGIRQSNLVDEDDVLRLHRRIDRQEG